MSQEQNNNSATSTAVRCHYEVLGVSLDADAMSIKKAYRKLALVHHPDKNIHHDDNDSAETFLLIQQAYECLSDPAERKWYDEHRDAILRGWSSATASSASDMEHMVFNVMPYMHAGSYKGFHPDTKDNFFAVYTTVFQQIYDNEYSNHDNYSNNNNNNNNNMDPRDFGSADTPWEKVAFFYQTWESFSSQLNFAWADLYNVHAETDHRRVKRAMEEENKKARRAARKARNEDILALLQFVKRRDPRVKAQRIKLEKEQAIKEKLKKEAEAKRKIETKKAREEWRQQAQEEMALLEEEDRLAGRIRLADLEDDYDYGGKKGKKKNAKNNKKKDDLFSSIVDPDVEALPNKEADDAQDGEPTNDDKLVRLNSLEEVSEVDVNQVHLDGSDRDKDTEDQDDSEEESEPDVWRCECCRKDFKSEAQMDNHLRSKKHKEAWKKYEKRVAQIEQAMMEEMLKP